MKRVLIIAGILLPFLAISQVNVHKTDSVSISTIMPFFEFAQLQNVPQANFSIQIPVAKIPKSIAAQPPIEDSLYDDPSDTIYAFDPILDYGIVIDTNLEMNNGVWQTTSSGKLWKMKIFIENAFNTSLHVDGFTLSPTALFYIVSGDLKQVKGPFVREVMLNKTVFGTFPMDGNSCYLLLYETNTENTGQNSLIVSSVIGGYQPIGDLGETNNLEEQQRANPTRCIPSIRCYEDWMNTARAVSRWTNGGGSVCSGTLLNNENLDGISFYYSAQHCLPVNRINLNRAAFQFQFWQTGCDNGINQNWIEFVGGATLLHEVGYNDGDAILLRLIDGPGIGDFPTYAGWSRQNSNPQKNAGAIIHHPRGADMRYTLPAKARDFWWDNDFWKVRYHPNTGLVLPGSSGSGLFNEHKQVIGNLSRGFPQTCFFRMSGDRFGKFHKGWNGMRNFLSPIHDNFSLGELSLSGMAINGSRTIQCNTTQFYSIQNLAGCTYTWTTSGNLSIISGAGTNRIEVINNDNTSTNGWVNVVINDSKGSFPDGRRAEFRLDINVVGTPPQIEMVLFSNAVGGEGYWCSTHNDNHFTVEPALQGVSYEARLLNWPGLTLFRTNNFAQPGVDPFGYVPSGWYVFQLRAASGCGTSNWYETEVEYVDCLDQGGGNFRITVSPNPTEGDLNVSIDKEKAEVKALGNATKVTYQLYNFNRTAIVKQWLFDNSQRKRSLDVRGLQAGQYILVVTKGKYRQSVQIIIK